MVWNLIRGTVSLQLREGSTSMVCCSAQMALLTRSVKPPVGGY